MEPLSAVVRSGRRNRPCLVRRPVAGAQAAPASSHLEVLRAGARAWNAWRRENPGVAPVLNGLSVSVTERQFGRVQGGPINLSRAELCGARLDQATLIEANLIGAELTEANLSDARLEQADLRGARLTYAQLGGARLGGANLCGADLRLSQGLTQAQIDQAVGDHRTLLPAHLAIPGAWLEQAPRGLVAGTVEDAEAALSERLGPRPGTSGRLQTTALAYRRRKGQRGRTGASARISRIAVAAALAAAMAGGALTAMTEAKFEVRVVAPGNAAPATGAIAGNGGLPAPPAVRRSPSG